MANTTLQKKRILSQNSLSPSLTAFEQRSFSTFIRPFQPDLPLARELTLIIITANLVLKGWKRPSTNKKKSKW